MFLKTKDLGGFVLPRSGSDDDMICMMRRPVAMSVHFKGRMSPWSRYSREVHQPCLEICGQDLFM